MSVLRHLVVVLGAALLVLLLAPPVAHADIAVPEDAFPDEGFEEDEPVEAPVDTVIEVDPNAADLNCEFLLTDQGENLADATPVVVAAGPLEAFGTVRVRLFDQTPNGSLDDALATAAADCGWLDADGEYPSDLLVFGVSIGDRATRVLYGDDWAPALDDSASVIIDRVVNAQFGEGDIEGGLVGGLEQFASLRAESDERNADDSSEPVTDVPDAVEEAPASTAVAGSADETQAAVGDESETSVAAAPTVEGQGSKAGTWALIAGVLVAIMVLPAVLLKRSRDNEEAKPG